MDGTTRGGFGSSERQPHGRDRLRFAVCLSVRAMHTWCAIMCGTYVRLVSAMFGWSVSRVVIVSLVVAHLWCCSSAHKTGDGLEIPSARPPGMVRRPTRRARWGGWRCSGGGRRGRHAAVVCGHVAAGGAAIDRRWRLAPTAAPPARAEISSPLHVLAASRCGDMPGEGHKTG